MILANILLKIDIPEKELKNKLINTDRQTDRLQRSYSLLLDGQ